MSKILIARNSFISELGGELVRVRKGQIVEDSDPLVSGREELFAPVEDRLASAESPAPARDPDPEPKPETPDPEPKPETPDPEAGKKKNGKSKP